MGLEQERQRAEASMYGWLADALGWARERYQDEYPPDGIYLDNLPRACCAAAKLIGRQRDDLSAARRSLARMREALLKVEAYYAETEGASLPFDLSLEIRAALEQHPPSAGEGE